MLNNPILKTVSRLALVVYALVLILVIISNLDLFGTNWPFELFASFTQQLIILFPLFFIIGLKYSGRFVPVVFMFGACAFWPFFTFSNYHKPSLDLCAANCVTVLFANMHSDPKALTDLKPIIDTYDPDIIGMSEAPYGHDIKRLNSTLPQYTFQANLTRDHSGKSLGSTLAIFSKDKILSQKVVIPESSGRHKRAVIKAQINNISVVIGHPMIPISPKTTKQRNIVIDTMADILKAETHFVIMGDFNMTPWGPMFTNLPGKRSHDPRWSITWPANRPLLGIPIDHILVSENLDVIDSKTLKKTSSDHHPIIMSVKLPAF